MRGMLPEDAEADFFKEVDIMTKMKRHENGKI